MFFLRDLQAFFIPLMYPPGEKFGKRCTREMIITWSENDRRREIPGREIVDYSIIALGMPRLHRFPISVVRPHDN